MRRISFFHVLLLLAALGAPAWSSSAVLPVGLEAQQDSDPADSDGSTTSTGASVSTDPTATGVGSGMGLDSVMLRPGDGLQIRIWREPDLSGQFVVDPGGAVTLPLLGSVRVTDAPLAEVEELLIERYRVELRNPSIEITPLLRLYVLGEVNRPGLLTVDPTVTLAGAVALAGGANPQGNLNDIQIMRDGETLLEDAGPEVDLMSIDLRSGDQIFVQRRSWFDRNSAFLVSAGLGVAGIVVQLLN